MKQSILDQKHFYNEKAASAYVERIIWKYGKGCPHCGNTGKNYELEVRVGLNKCAECKKEFTYLFGLASYALAPYAKDCSEKI